MCVNIHKILDTQILLYFNSYIYLIHIYLYTVFVYIEYL